MSTTEATEQKPSETPSSEDTLTNATSMNAYKLNRIQIKHYFN